MRSKMAKEKSPLKPFEIEIQGLAVDQHFFDFQFDGRLFQAFEGALIEKGSGTVNLDLIKSETMMTLAFEIKGSVELICDRSLRPFDYPIDIREELIVKFGDEYAELDDDIIVIGRETQHFNVGQYIYEMISVAVPMKKIHPELLADDEDDDSEGGIVYQSHGDVVEQDDTENVDPRWEALKKLRNN